MDQKGRAKQLLNQGDSQTNLNYWKIIRDCNVTLNSCQNEFKAASNHAINHLNLSQELSVANVQLTMEHTKSLLKKDLCCPNPLTADRATSSSRATCSMAKDVQQLFKLASQSAVPSKIAKIPHERSINLSISSARSEAASVSSSASLSYQASLIHQSARRAARSSAASDSVNVSQVLSSRSRALNSKVSSILTQPTSSANHHITVLPVKVRYYDIDSNKLIKKGLATGGYGQMINVTDLVPLPKGYRPYFYQKLYYNVTSHPQTAVIFVTNRKINLKAVTQHQLIHNKIKSDKNRMSSSSNQKCYLSSKDFNDSPLRYLLIKKNMFVYSQKDLDPASRDHKLINGEIIPIKRLINYHNKVIALLPNGQYITARKDFVTVFKV